MASQLSPRQREILDLVAEGRTSKEIAVTLGISESTVNWHLANVFERLGASSRAEAVALAIRSNGTDHVAAPPTRLRPAAFSAHMTWTRLIATAIAIAVAGALLGGATVAALRLGPVGPGQPPLGSPANGADRTPTLSPASGSREGVGGDAVPSNGGSETTDPIGEAPASPASLVPVVSAPPLPSVPLNVTPPALPSLPVTPPPLPTLPVTPPPLPSVPISLPTPIPTPPPLP